MVHICWNWVIDGIGGRHFVVLGNDLGIGLGIGLGIDWLVMVADDLW